MAATARGRLQQPSRRRRQAAVGALLLILVLLILLVPSGGQTALLMMLLLAPALGFWRWSVQQQQNHGVTDQELKQVGLCFAAGVFPAPLLAMLAQGLLLPLAALLCFFDQRASLRAQLQSIWDESGDNSSSSSGSSLSGYDASSSSSSSTGTPSLPHASRLADVLQQLDVEKSFGYFVFLFIVAFCVAALVEETLKLWIVQGACCDSCCGGGGSKRRGGLCHPSRLLFQHPRHSSHAFVVFMGVVAGALGFSLFENAGYAFGAGTFRDRVLAAVLRGCVSTPLHCICGGITGVRLAERLQRRRRRVATAPSEKKGATAAEDLSRWRTKLALVAPSLVLHGVFDLQVLVVASLVTEEMETAHPVAYGIVAPSVGTVAILIGGFVYLRRALHAMERQMNAGRYIQVAVDLESGRRVGFSDSDDDDDDDGEEFDSDDDDVVRAQQQEREFGRGGAPRKTRSVFNV